MNAKSNFKHPLVKLQEITTKIGSGATPRGGQDSYKTTGITLIRSLNIYDFKFEYEGLAFIDETQAKQLSNVEVKLNDILLNITGASVARCCMVPPQLLPARVNQHVAIVRVSPLLANPYYVFYCINSPQYKNRLLALAQGGATREALTKETISNFEIPFPPLPTQNKIASILSAYDDLIENNTRRIKILEEMAQTLYHEWFFKFRFPGYEQTKMVDSELGLIPEGWKFRKLEELGFLGRGKSKHRPKNDPSLYGGDYPFIQTGEVKEAFLYITNYNQTYNKKGLEQSKLWETGTLLITIAANIAETAILTFPACFPDSIVGFVAYSNNVNAEFIKYSIDGIKLRMQNVSKGTTQDNLSLEKIRIFDFLVPEKETMQLFIKITTPIFSQMKNLLLKNQNLSKTRDLLLPKLISGEIDVEHLEITTEDIAA